MRFFLSHPTLNVQHGLFSNVIRKPKKNKNKIRFFFSYEMLNIKCWRWCILDQLCDECVCVSVLFSLSITFEWQRKKTTMKLNYEPYFNDEIVRSLISYLIVFDSKYNNIQRRKIINNVRSLLFFLVIIHWVHQFELCFDK